MYYLPFCKTFICSCHIHSSEMCHLVPYFGKATFIVWKCVAWFLLSESWPIFSDCCFINSLYGIIYLGELQRSSHQIYVRCLTIAKKCVCPFYLKNRVSFHGHTMDGIYGFTMLGERLNLSSLKSKNGDNIYIWQERNMFHISEHYLTCASLAFMFCFTLWTKLAGAF